MNNQHTKSNAKRREQALVSAALAVEAEEALHDEMRDWDVTIADCIDEEVPYSRASEHPTLP